MSKPYEILAALKEHLESIKTENGYNHDVSSVHIGMRSPDKINDRPTLDIEAEGTDHEYFEGSANTVSALTIVIRGYVDPSDNAVEQQWKLVEDIADAVSSNITLGLSYQFDMKYLETATDGGLDLTDRYPRMVFVLVEVLYEHLDTEY
jgi:hypothetical protein